MKIGNAVDTTFADPRILGDSGAADSPRLRSLLLDSYRNVPFYHELFTHHGVTGHSLANGQGLADLPIITKNHLLAQPIARRLNRRFTRRRLRIESTSGSTGQPFDLCVDRAYKIKRNIRFLRGLLSVGYRPWQAMMLLTDRFPDPVTRRRNWTYCSVEQTVAGIVDTYRRTNPQVVYGFATPLRLLAERLRDSGTSYCVPALIISTAEMLDPTTESIFKEVFRCPVADFYGMTETGLVAWRRPGDARYTMAGKSIVAELLPQEKTIDQYRLVVTNLDLQACPIIRYETGDLVQVESLGSRVSLTRIDGRRIDAVRCMDGSRLSPYVITDALRTVSGVRRFRVVQDATDHFNVELELDDVSQTTSATDHVSRIFRETLGADLRLSFSIHDNLVTEKTRKFRPVECRVNLS